MPSCKRCGAKVNLFFAMSADTGNGVCCDSCMSQENAEEAERTVRLRERAAKVVLTTTPAVDGYYVKRYVGIESVEYVIGTGIFSEVNSSVADLFGLRSNAFEAKLQQAKQTALAALQYRAAQRGANAVVAVDLDYAEFSGNRVALIVNGTLVELAARNAASVGAPVK